MTVNILAHDQERARDAILEAFALNEDQLAPATVPADRTARSLRPLLFQSARDRVPTQWTALAPMKQLNEWLQTRVPSSSRSGGLGSLPNTAETGDLARFL